MDKVVVVISGTSRREREMMSLLEDVEGLKTIEEKEPQRLADIGKYIVNMDEMILIPCKNPKHPHVMSMEVKNRTMDMGKMIRRMRKKKII